MGNKKISFEEAMNQLEEIVGNLEKGNLPLEKSLETFKKGIELTKYCNHMLESVEKEINILVEKENGDIEEQLLKGV